jgi:hypothetical protein
MEQSMMPLAAPEPRITAPEAELEADPLAKLALLHAEAEETARLANLAGRSLYIALILPVLCIFAIGVAAGASLASQLVWGVFIAFATIAVLRAYQQAMAQPFERTVLKSFAKDMSAILLYAGFAWGAGAFLGLAAGTGMAASIVFVAVPSIAVAILLREREAVFLFLAPASMVTAFACVLRPFADGALDAGLVLIAGSAIAAVTAVMDRRRQTAFGQPSMLPLG